MTINDAGSGVLKTPPFLSYFEKENCLKNPKNAVGRKHVNRTNQMEIQEKDEQEMKFIKYSSLESDNMLCDVVVNETERQKCILNTYVCENDGDDKTKIKATINEQVPIYEGIHREPREAPQVKSNPFETSKIHDCLLCCTNGHFRMTAGPFSEFESNCGCTTHILVDWKTRVTWSSLSLRHQYKVHEVTNLSPYRALNDKRVLPFSRAGFHKAQRLSATAHPTESPTRGVSSSSIEDTQHPSTLRELLDASPHVKEETREFQQKYESKFLVCAYYYHNKLAIDFCICVSFFSVFNIV